MSKQFEIYPYSDDEIKLYECESFTFDPGVTVLVGCNGSGKTTLMNRMIEQLESENVKYFKHYCHQANKKLEGELTYKADFQSMKKWMDLKYCSEGEALYEGFYQLSQNMGYYVYHEAKDEAWIFLDSLDSGMSIDVIDELCKFFKNTLLKDAPQDLDVYIIIASNSYEFASRFKSVYVVTGEEVKFSNYSDYKKFILDTRKVKNKRKKKPKKKSRRSKQANIERDGADIADPVITTKIYIQD